MMFENSVVEVKTIPFPTLYAPLYHYPEFQNASCNACGFPGQNHSIRTGCLQKPLVVLLIKSIICWKTSRALPQCYFDSAVKL